MKTLLALILSLPALAQAQALTQTTAPDHDLNATEIAALYEQAVPAGTFAPNLLLAGECKTNPAVGPYYRDHSIFSIFASAQGSSGARADIFTTQFRQTAAPTGDFFTHHQLILRHYYGHDFGPYGSYGRPDPTGGYGSDYWWHPRLEKEAYSRARATEEARWATHGYGAWLRGLLKLKAARFPDSRSPGETTFAQLLTLDQPNTYLDTWNSLAESFEHPEATAPGTQYGFGLALTASDEPYFQLTRKSYRWLDDNTLLMAQHRAELPLAFRDQPLTALRSLPADTFREAAEYYCIWYRNLSRN